MILSFVIAVTLILLVFYLSKNGRRGKKYPPGPYSWPVVGNLFQLSLEPHKDYIKLSKQYGDIFAIDFGSMKSVVLNDYKLIKEAYNHTDISGRPPFLHFLEPETGLAKGIIFTEGKEWMEQRRFVLKTLRDFGFGKKSMESMVHEEIKELIESLKEGVGKPFSTKDRFNVAVFNALWTIVAGERYPQTEGKINKLVHHLTANMEDSTVAGTIFSFPWFAKSFPQLSGLNALMKNNIPIFSFMREVISAHTNTFESGNNRDLLDCYLEQMNKTTDPDSSFHKNNGDSHLVMTLYDLFLGGTETTSSTLMWMFYLLGGHPEVQEKMDKEIKNVIGDARLPSLTDKTNLPYVEAVVAEVMRFSSLIPITFRRTMEDVEFKGYRIPKGTAVMANLYGVNYDTTIWGDPENFRPERFLSEDGSTALKHEALIPFGYGRRFCLGESLARDQIFLFSTSLIQRFKVDLAPKGINDKEVIGATMLQPKPHRVILHDRYAD